MSMLYLSPEWFYGYDIAFKVFFALISLAISAVAFKVYRASSQRPACFLSIAFLLIALGHGAQSLLWYAMVADKAIISNIALYTHIMFMSTGLTILLYMILKLKKAIVFWLLLALTLISIDTSSNIYVSYYLISSIYLAIISWHYSMNFLEKRQTKTLLVAIAFLFLFFGSFHFFLAVNHQLFYTIGNVLEFMAYMLILSNLYLVLRK